MAVNELKRISVVDSKAALDTLTILDIRDEHAFAQSHMPGAIHLHNGNLAQVTAELEFEQPLLVVCYHGISSLQAATYLISQGFENVASMDGGFEAWRLQYGTEPENR